MDVNCTVLIDFVLDPLKYECCLPWDDEKLKEKVKKIIKHPNKKKKINYNTINDPFIKKGAYKNYMRSYKVALSLSKPRNMNRIL